MTTGKPPHKQPSSRHLGWLYRLTPQGRRTLRAIESQLKQYELERSKWRDDRYHMELSAYRSLLTEARNAYREEVRKNYKIFRDYEEHENNLVNHRMTWLITAQAVLFATGGFSLQKYFELLQKSPPPSQILDGHALLFMHVSFGSLLLLLVLIGIVTASNGRKGIAAAGSAQERLRDLWRDNHGAQARVMELPDISGGGSPEAIALGHSLTLRFPIFFERVWWGLGSIGVLMGATAAFGILEWFGIGRYQFC